MPRGPRGEKRPADVAQGAFMALQIATGEIVEDACPPSNKTRSGRAGAKARAESLTHEERSAIARRAAAARWS